MSSHAVAAAIVIAIVAWVAVLFYAVPPWMNFWWQFSGGEFWGLVGALSPLLILVYAAITWASRK